MNILLDFNQFKEVLTRIDNHYTLRNEKELFFDVVEYEHKYIDNHWAIIKGLFMKSIKRRFNSLL
jgi:hypothetical protein